MRAIDLEALKNKLSEYVRLAAGGEVVLVTDRDRVVAELHPPSPGRAEDVADAFLADLMRRGWLRPAASPGAGVPPSLPVPGLTVRQVVEEVAADREDR